jgi:hypothetical protein
MSRKIPPISFSWDEGVYFDVWMVVHMLSGFTLGLFAGLFLFEKITAFLSVCTFLILWEVGEIIMKIDEAPINRIIDVVVGIIGFFIAWTVVESVGASNLFMISLFSVIVLATLNVFGWRAHRTRLKSKK